MLTKNRKKKIYSGLYHIKDPTPKELMTDLKIRSDYHAKDAARKARSHMTINKTLTVFSFVLVAYISLQLTLNQSGIINNKYIIWTTAICGFLSMTISILQVFIFDEKTAIKLFHISQEFYEIKNQAKLFEVKHQSIGAEGIIDFYSELHSKYNEKRATYLEFIEDYYGKALGPGKIRKLDKIQLENTEEDFDN